MKHGDVAIAVLCAVMLIVAIAGKLIFQNNLTY